MWLDKLKSELSRAFATRNLKLGGPVRLRVRYCLGGGKVSVSSSSCVMKVIPVVFVSGGMMDGSLCVVPTLICVSGMVHGTTLVGASGRGSIGCIVGVTVGCGGVMAPQKSLLVVTWPPACEWKNMLRSTGAGGFVGRWPIIR